MRHHPVSAILLVGLFAACSPPPASEQLYVQDDLDSNLFAGKQDRLEVPYVRGAAVTLYVNSSGTGDADFSDWTLRSSDEDVFEVLEVRATSDDFDVEGLATGAGEAELEVVDASGHIAHSVAVEVAFPDSIELTPHVVSYVPELADVFADETPRVLNDHIATFEVTYYRDDERLHGNGVLTSQSGASLRIESDDSNFLEDREWLRINPIAPGTHTVALEVDGTSLGSLDIEAIDPAELTRISLQTESVVGASTGDRRHVVALGYDTADAPVLGVNPTWELGSEPTTEPGDLYIYEYDPTQVRPLLASFAPQADGDPTGFEEEIYIYGRFGDVATSNAVGCSSAPIAAPTMLWLAGLLGVRRSRITKTQSAAPTTSHDAPPPS